MATRMRTFHPVKTIGFGGCPLYHQSKSSLLRPIVMSRKQRCVLRSLPSSTSKTAHRNVTPVTASASPNWNPQNVPTAKVRPSLEFSPEESVRVQLNAVADNNIPWDNHGIQVMYDFCEGAGGMERSRYFGYSKDLYHFDHFMGCVRSTYPALFSLASYEITSVQPLDSSEQRWSVKVTITTNTGQLHKYIFTQCKMAFGLFKGCWMTESLLEDGNA
eukprot:CAMPEP_0197862994 /NCGR_PEP_ID=MMETSP1438-20131217/40147_1 /TAXON_ID=1461541 /ORGANISM="Pterosperma sp., Strain CCMP1384" /LENGTH=216 /DNA_ID=CAMNT_0043480731 /DNA_START=1 /DNA_END=651 /DNA_ORIENTATION=+